MAIQAFAPAVWPGTVHPPGYIEFGAVAVAYPGSDRVVVSA